MALTLVIMAAGLATRFGGSKQLARVGPAGEALLDYCVFDAVRAGFARIVFVIRGEMANAMAAHAAERYGERVPVAFAEQRVDDLPAGLARPPGRTKPWGTAHAVLAARALVNGPMAVCNADDFYGREAFDLLAQHLRAQADVAALVGYRLEATLSPHGAVSRGVCQTDAAGWLARIVEVPDVRWEGGAIVGHPAAGVTRTFAGDASASMNLWGFPPAVPGLLPERFRAFLERTAGDPDAEWPLSTVVNELVAGGRLRVRVLLSSESWFGMTYAGDLPAVRERLAALVRAGIYPPDLRTGLARL